MEFAEQIICAAKNDWPQSEHAQFFLRRIFHSYINKELYRTLEKKTLESLTGQPTYSQIDIFANVPETIYYDQVHPVLDYSTGYSRGYTMMATDIAEKAAPLWHLQRIETKN